MREQQKQPPPPPRHVTDQIKQIDIFSSTGDFCCLFKYIWIPVCCRFLEVNSWCIFDRTGNAGTHLNCTWQDFKFTTWNYNNTAATTDVISQEHKIARTKAHAKK